MVRVRVRARVTVRVSGRRSEAFELEYGLS